MKPLAILVHGFNVSDGGKNSTDKLRPYLEAAGFEVKELDYGWAGIVQASDCDRRMAEAMAAVAQHEQEVVAIGHSNGCKIIADATQRNAEFDQVVLINPAIKRDFKFGPVPSKIHIWYSPGDKAVRIGRFTVPWLWGDMGAVGYKGNDPRCVNYNKQEIPPYSKSHSDVFEDDKLKVFGPMIVQRVMESI